MNHSVVNWRLFIFDFAIVNYVIVFGILFECDSYLFTMCTVFFFFCIFRLNVSCVYSSRGCNLCVILIFGESSKKYVLKLR